MQILKVLDDNPSYGLIRVALELKIGKRRGRRVMKKYGIKPTKGKPDGGKEEMKDVRYSHTKTSLK